MKKEQINHAEMCIQDFVVAISNLAECLDDITISREDKLEIIDELGWASGEIFALGDAACIALETEREFRDYIR